MTATNDAGLSTNASVWITVVTPLDLTNVFVPDTNLMPLESGGDAPWFGQTNVSLAGAVVAQSGSISNSGASLLQAVVTNGPGIVTYWWKVSSETNYDFLSFNIGTNEQARISGEVDWEQQSHHVPSGSNLLVWKYSKDYRASAGSNAGWVADIRFVSGSSLQVAGTSTNGGCQLDLYLKAGTLYEILASSNLVNWLQMAVVLGTDGKQAFVDKEVKGGPRLYRLRELGVPPWLELVAGPTNGANYLTLYLEPGKLYEVLASTNLVNWFRLDVVVATNCVNRLLTQQQGPRCAFITCASWGCLRGWSWLQARRMGRITLLCILSRESCTRFWPRRTWWIGFELAVVPATNSVQSFVDTAEVPRCAFTICASWRGLRRPGRTRTDQYD